MSKSNFIAGALIGVVAGLLIAPQKGEDLREDIADSAIKLKKKLTKIAGQTSNELSDLHEMLENEIDGLSESVRYRLLAVLNDTLL